MRLKVILVIVAALAVFSCSYLSPDPVPLPPGFCDDAGPRSDSHLLAISGKLVKNGDMTAEEALNATYNFMIRGAALAQVVEPDAKQFLQKWWKELGVFYLDHVEDGLTWDDLIDFMFSEEKWGSRVTLIKIVVDPNYQSYRSLVNIGAWDNCALKSGHRRVGEIFNFGPLKAKGGVDHWQQILKIPAHRGA